MNKINLTLDINEVNIIIKSLSTRPFGEVYELIGKVHAQYNVQLPNQISQPQPIKAQKEKAAL